MEKGYVYHTEYPTEKELELMKRHLKELRKERGLNQREIAEIIQVDIKTYGQWERGTNKNSASPNPKIDRFIALADFYGVSVDYILGRSDFRNPENEFIGAKTGLTDQAIEALQILNAPVSDLEDESDIFQEGRYDTIVINLVLEDFLKRYKKTEPRKAFSPANTQTLLNLIGEYIDCDSGAGTSLVPRNGTTRLVNNSEAFHYEVENDLRSRLKEFHEKYSLLIHHRMNNRKEAFREFYERELKEFYKGRSGK